MNKKTIDSEIKNYEPSFVVGSQEHWAYRVLLTLPVVGPFKDTDEVTDKVTSYWSTKKKSVKTMCRRSWMNNIVRVGKKHHERFIDGELYEGIGLAMGASILLGYVRRVKP